MPHNAKIPQNTFSVA